MNRDEWRASTSPSYRAAIDKYLVPAFGPLRLEQLTPQAVQRWLTTHKQEHGARRRITLAHAALRSALTEAQRLQLVTINAATLVKVPKPTPHAVAPLTLERARAFLAGAEAHRLGALFSVALACGLRLGEAIGLRWDDVNLTSGEIQIRQQLQRVGKRLILQDLKTEKSRRTLALPRVCLEALRDHRKCQREERLKAGAAWTDSGLVFTTYAPRGKAHAVGAPLHPRNVLRVLHAVEGREPAAEAFPRSAPQRRESVDCARRRARRGQSVVGTQRNPRHRRSLLASAETDGGQSREAHGCRARLAPLGCQLGCTWMHDSIDEPPIAKIVPETGAGGRT